MWFQRWSELIHSPEAGYTYLEENDWLSDGQLSASSIIHTSKGKGTKSATVLDVSNDFRARAHRYTRFSKLIHHL
jgi:hypothetical protein